MNGLATIMQKSSKKASTHYIPIRYNLIVVVKRIAQLANFLSTIVEWVSRKIYILSFTRQYTYVVDIKAVTLLILSVLRFPVYLIQHF